MTTSSPQRPRASATGGAADRKRRIGRRRKAAEFEDVAARAARLGITIERVLREYASIAFADLRHIVKEGPDGRLQVVTLDELSDADAAPIQEIVVGAEGKHPSRVRLYDKKAALAAIARHLGMFPPPQRRREDEGAEGVEDAREELARLLDRLAPEGAEE